MILHAAVSLDGKIDCFTPDLARFCQLARHWAEDATLVGADTVLMAGGAAAGSGDWGTPAGAGTGPAATGAAAEAGVSLPILAVTDPRGRVRDWARLRASGY